jgi:hypothetical protein
MEGKFASDGLQAIDEGDDILMAMARELVTEKGIGESAAAVWKDLQRQQAEVIRTPTVEGPVVDAEIPAVIEPEVIVPPLPLVPGVVTQLLMFGDSLERVRRSKTSRRSAAVAKPSNQLSLF